MAAMIANEGVEKAQELGEGLLANLARPPAGADTDQLKGLVSGECDVAVVNTYYFARALAEPVEGVSEGIDKIGWVFPNQDTTGTHVNISAGGVAAHAPHPEAAVEIPRVSHVALGAELFRQRQLRVPDGRGGRRSATSPPRSAPSARDTLNLSVLGEKQPLAQKIFNEIGFP